MGRLFTLLPWGEAAWRVNLMSAVFASGTVGFLSLLLIYVTRNRFAAVGAALAFACSRTFWSQAVIAEVYAMTAFCMVLCFLALLVWSDSGKKRMLYVSAFLLGMGLVVHNTFVFIVPPVVMYVIAASYGMPSKQEEFKGAKASTALFFCFFMALPLLSYLYLPIRSVANPPLDWGNPETLDNFVRMVRRSQYDFMFHQYPRNFGRFIGQMLVYGRFWMGEFLPWGAVSGCMGLVLLLFRRFLFAMMLFISAVLIVGGFSFWQNFEHTREWLWVMRVFGIPAYLVTAVGIGVFLAAIWRRGMPGVSCAVLAALLCIAPSLSTHWRFNDKSSYYWTYEYGRNILHTLAPDAIYISESDHGSFSVLYLQTVEGMRPDVENLRKYGYLQSTLFDDMPLDLKQKIGEFPARRHDPEIIGWLLTHTQRPIYLAKPMKLPGTLPVRIMPAGLLFRVLRPGEQEETRSFWEEYCWTSLSAEDARGDYTAEAVCSEIEMTRARAAFLESESLSGIWAEAKRAKALRHLEDAVHIYGHDAVILNNAGVLCARHRCYDQARYYFQEALKLLPHLSEPGKNLNRLNRRVVLDG
jgi:hypothetical protein